MVGQIKYVASWTRVKLSNRIGQRGAEMVEYAVVLACIAAVGVAFYKAAAGNRQGDKGLGTLNGVLTDSWELIYNIVDKILQ